MVGRRLILTALRSRSTATKPIHCQRPMITCYSLTRPISSFGPRSPNQPKSPMNIINKRYSSGQAGGSSGYSLTSKLAGALGAFLAIGAGAFYNETKDSNFNKNYVAECAADDNCGKKIECPAKCPNPDCVDKCGNKIPCPQKCPPDCIEKKCDSSACLRSKDCEEELISKANKDLERALKDTKGKATEFTEIAMKAYCEAIPAMCEFLNQGYCIIDNDELETPEYEEGWCCVYEIAKKRCEKVKDALSKAACAWELLCRLREVIENGKACKYTACNPLLVTAQESLECAENELLTLKGKMDCVASKHEMAKIYKEVIEAFRSELESEVKSKALMDAMGCCDIKYKEQEMALMISQAYKKVVDIQKEMAQTLVCNGTVPERLAKTCC